MLVLTADPSLNQRSIEPLIAQLETGAARSARALVVDFAGLVELSSQGIGNLLQLQKRLLPLNVTVRMAALREDQASVLQITRVHTMIEMFDTVDQAVAKP